MPIRARPWKSRCSICRKWAERQHGSVARPAFLLLVLINLAFFVWAAGYLGGTDPGREPDRLRNQLNPEKLKIVLAEIKAETTPEPDVQPEPAVVGTAGPELVCRRIGPVAAAEADRLAARLAADAEVRSIPVEGRSYWIFIPAADARPTDKTAAELRQAGFSDFFVVSDDGPNRGAFSLGLYHKEDAANDLLQRLGKKGIESARVESKPRKTDKAVLEIRASAEVVDRALSGVTAEVAGCEGG